MPASRPALRSLAAPKRATSGDTLTAAALPMTGATGTYLCTGTNQGQGYIITKTIKSRLDCHKCEEKPHRNIYVKVIPCELNFK